MENGAKETLEVLASAGKTVELTDGKVVTVKVCSGKVLPKMLTTVSKIAESLELDLKDTKGIEEKLLSKLNNVGFLLQLISNYSVDVFSLTADLSDMGSADAVADLPLDDLARVVLRVVEVNRDFFMTRVLPVIKAAAGTAL